MSDPTNPLNPPDGTPEDVATLYSWANLHGAKYRDFSAARAQTREKARLRAEQALEEEHRPAAGYEEPAEVAAARSVPIGEPIYAEPVQAEPTRIQWTQVEESEQSVGVPDEPAYAQSFATEPAALPVHADVPTHEVVPAPGEPPAEAAQHEPEAPISHPAAHETAGAVMPADPEREVHRAAEFAVPPVAEPSARDLAHQAAESAAEQARQQAQRVAHQAAELAAQIAAEQVARQEELKAAEEAARQAREHAAQLEAAHAAQLAQLQAARQAAEESAKQAAAQAAQLEAHYAAERDARRQAEESARQAAHQAAEQTARHAAGQARLQAALVAEQQAAERSAQHAAELARAAQRAQRQAAEEAKNREAAHAAEKALQEAALRAAQSSVWQHPHATEPATQAPVPSIHPPVQPANDHPPVQPHLTHVREESSMSSRNPWATPETPESAGKPAWLAHEPSEVPPSSGSPASPPPAADDTLQASRDRLTSRWFALRGIFDAVPPPPEPPPAPVVARPPAMAVFSLAGGVGKTSLVATLGRSLSARGERVLLVDTAAFGLLPFFFGATDQRPGVLRTFNPPGLSSDAPVQMITLDPEGLVDEAPGQDSLNAEIGKFSRGVGRVIVDLATASGATTRRILRLQPLVLVPMVPDMNSVVSVSSIDAFFEHNTNPGGKPSLPFYLLNQFEPTQPLHLDVREVLREQLGERLLPFVLRRAPALSEALAEGMTIVDYAPNSPLAEDFATLAGWVKSLSAPATTSYRGVRWSER